MKTSVSNTCLYSWMTFILSHYLFWHASFLCHNKTRDKGYYKEERSTLACLFKGFNPCSVLILWIWVQSRTTWQKECTEAKRLPHGDQVESRTESQCLLQGDAPNDLTSSHQTLPLPRKLETKSSTHEPLRDSQKLSVVPDWIRFHARCCTVICRDNLRLGLWYLLWRALSVLTRCFQEKRISNPGVCFELQELDILSQLDELQSWAGVGFTLRANKLLLNIPGFPCPGLEG